MEFAVVPPFTRLAFLFLALSYISLPLVLDAQAGTQDSKSPMEWFAHASDRMNLRMPGSQPFHMRVTFHAYPGEELLPPEKSEIITGDGTYDEIWLEPHKWRREVTLASYHAIEQETGGVRKMQASSDYEPSRVLMLLKALLIPIPRNLVSKEYGRQGASGWAIDRIEKNQVALVRISNEASFGADFNWAYYLSPHGLLLFENECGLVTSWEDDRAFAGGIVPTHINFKASDRELLSANLNIEAVHQDDSALADLPVDRAEPGMTLRPLQFYELKLAELVKDLPPWADAERQAFVAVGVVDRTGRFREAELIDGINITKNHALAEALNDIRKTRWRPARIDDSPAEFFMRFNETKIVH